VCLFLCGFKLLGTARRVVSLGVTFGHPIWIQAPRSVLYPPSAGLNPKPAQFRNPSMLVSSRQPDFSRANTVLSRPVDHDHGIAMSRFFPARPPAQAESHPMSGLLQPPELAELAALVCEVAGTDAALAERAFAQLYSRTASRVQAWREAARFDAARGCVLAWLLTITRSRALDWYRRRQAQPVQFDSELAEACADMSADADPLDIIVSTDSRSAVHAALAALPARARQFVALAFLRGLTHQEIADVTGEPLGTVKTTIRRALGDMKQHLQSRTPELALQFAASN
jgi:RNA polymerase sigma factor (sigma-70 family)